MTTKTTVAPGGSFTVPAGISRLRAIARGAAGQVVAPRTSGAGRGALIQALLSVTPGQTFPVASIPGGLGAAGSSPASAGGKGGDGINIAGLLFAGAGAGAGGVESAGTTSGVGGDGGLPNGVDGGAGINYGANGGWLEYGHGAMGDAGGAAGVGWSPDGAPPFSTISGGSPGSAGKNHADGGAGGPGGAAGSQAGGGAGGGGGYAGGGGGRGGQGGRGTSGAGAGGGSSFGGDLIGFNTSTVADALFETAAAPLMPTLLTPTGNAYADRTAPIVLAFSHSPASPDSLDVQSDAQVRHRKVATPAGAWTTVTGLGTATSYEIPAGTYADGDQVEWQAMTYADGLPGPWSTSEYFRAATPPATPVITSPASGATIGTAAIVVAWTHAGQVAYQTRAVNDVAGAAGATVYADSGPVTSSALTATLTVKVNEVSAHVQVRVQDIAGGLWSQWADVPISILWEPPATPTVYQRPDPEHGSIVMVIDNPTPTGVQPAPTVNRVFITEGGVESRRAVIAPGTDWEYWTPVGEVGVRVEAVDESTGVLSSTEVIW